MDTLDRSLPMLFLRMFHRLMLLVSGDGAGRQMRRPLRKALATKSPLATREGGGGAMGREGWTYYKNWIRSTAPGRHSF